VTAPVKLRVFVSYTRADQEWAEWVSQVIESAGHTVALQSWDIAAGDNFVSWITEQLAKADCVLPIYSADYFESFWCTQEWTAALTRAASGDSALIAVRVAVCDIPAILRPLVYIDLVGKSRKLATKLVERGLGGGTRARLARQGFPGVADRATELTRLRARWKRAAVLGTIGGFLLADTVFDVPDVPDGPDPDPGDLDF
jgi:TIR domain-containing protein/Ras family protein